MYFSLTLNSLMRTHQQIDARSLAMHAFVAADFYPLNRPELADLIDGAMGEMSPFEERFRYCARGVGSTTAILLSAWETRLVKIQNENTDLKIGYCLPA